MSAGERGIWAPTVVFTDVVGSAALYARFGDARAFHLVSVHFAALRAVVLRHRGNVVKTMGDSLMAVFADPADAVAAALRFDAAAAPLDLRVGVHRGHCIVAEENGVPDYFGATVNVAARVMRAGVAGEVLLSAAVANDARVAARFPSEQRASRTLRGIGEPVDTMRIATRSPAGSALAPAA